jgi:hypothetical protein
MEEKQESGAASAGGRPRKGLLVLGVISAFLIAGIMLLSLTIAGAQTPTPTPTPSQAPEEGAAKGPGLRGGKHGIGGGIHGEFVTRAPGGGYQTLASQTGEVTSVSSSSIAVRSEDGFSRTYRVDDNTLVNAGRDGIADVSDGDTVRLVAVVDGDTARAVQIFDGTRVGELRGRWQPPRPERPASEGAEQNQPTA